MKYLGKKIIIIDNSNLSYSGDDLNGSIIRGTETGSLRSAQEYMYVIATNYNVLRIKDGLAGILFGN